MSRFALPLFVSHPLALLVRAAVPIAVLLAAQIGEASRYELRGVMVDGADTRFSIHDQSQRTSIWLAPGQRHQDLVVVAPSDEFSCLVEIGGARHVLRLVKSRLGDSPAGMDAGESPAIHPPFGGAPGGADNTSRARQAHSLARGLDSTPAPSPASTFGRAAGRGATVGATPTVAQISEPGTIPPAPATNPGYTPLLGRKVNTVNSRIHASDHIKKFGPAPAAP